MVLWRLKRSSRTNTQKRCHFHFRGLGAKIGSQETLGVTGKFGLGVQNEAGKRLIQFCQGEHIGYSKHPVPTIQKKTLPMDITRWSILKSDWLYSWHPKMEKIYAVSKSKTGSWLWLWSWTSLLPNLDLNWRKQVKP